MTVILLSKTDRYSGLAQDIARETFPDLQVFEGRVGDPEPIALNAERADVLISFLSPWIVRKEVLDRCGLAINFHPGSADYPGIGCYNFALYEEAEEFGAVCHHMLPKVDTGRIILERRFPVSPDDSVETLKLATMNVIVGMFREIVTLIAEGRELPQADTQWTRQPFTRREMDSLKVCRHDMPADEVRRRVRASIYPGYPGPVMHLPCGSVREYPVPQRPALA